MNFISTKELAEKWKISPSRVLLLAKNGRIPGAKLVGKTWLYPENSVKPDDKRTKEAKEARELKKELPFRFPLYHFTNYSIEEVETEFTIEERMLYHAEECYLKNDLSATYDLCQQLLKRTLDRPVEIGCLYFLCKSCLFRGLMSEFATNAKKFRSIFKEDFPYKKELELIAYDLETLYQGNEFFLTHYVIDSTYHYHPSSRKYMIILSCYSSVMQYMVMNYRTSAQPYEIICQYFEDSGSPLFMMYLHMYIAAISLFSEDMDSAYYHLKKSLSIAIEHNMLHTISFFYQYAQHYFDAIIESPEFAKAAVIRDYCNEYYRKLRDLIHYLGETSIFSILEPKDFTYINFLFKGRSIKEIAASLNLSVSTVSKRYSEIYQKTNTKGRRELKELLNKSLFEY